MADATLREIDAALVTALEALQAGPPTDSQPFALVSRFAGDLTEDTIGEACAQYPCALLSWDGETATRTDDTHGPDSEDVGRSAWTVVVALEDPRDITDAIRGAAGVPGALALVSAAIGACNALYVTGLWRGRSVRYVRTDRLRTKRGVFYAYAVRFEVLRTVEDADDPVVSTEDFTGVDADENLLGETDTAPDPYQTIKADVVP